jgi:hypothetical protein
MLWLRNLSPDLSHETSDYRIPRYKTFSSYLVRLQRDIEVCKYLEVKAEKHSDKAATPLHPT